MTPEILYTHLPYWGFFAIIAAFFCRVVLSFLSLRGIGSSLIKIFDNIDISSEPQPKELIIERQNFINKSLKDIKKTELSLVFLMIIILAFFLSVTTPATLKGSFLSSVVTSTLLITGFLSFVLFGGMIEIKSLCHTSSNKNSFLKYSDIMDDDVDFIKTTEVSKNYFMSVASSGREMTKYEINMLKDFANNKKKK